MSQQPPTGYERPESLERALALRAEAAEAGGGAVLAGGTDLFAMTARPGLAGPVLDLTGCAALQGLSCGPDGLRIGAATTWTEVAEARLPAACAGLRAAARQVGSRQIQNRGTVGGNLCNASPAADGVPPLLTLDAEVELASVRGTRRLPLAAFLHGPRATALAGDELLTAVILPSAALAGRGGFEKLGARAHLVISIAMAAARLETSAGRVTAAALALGACGPVAARLPEVEAALVGRPADATLAGAVTDAAVAAAIAPIDDIRADAAYRRRAAAEILRRAVAAALDAPAAPSLRETAA
ncbi:MAG: FAD binding domain-containing protein [Pseudomonadota bacterium]|nr:FAD binding domain-containing protein [Pseudomonadota bacterium]MEE3098388.1 FAD binding domain-containing protein [Pseudomonadota bacterium]